VDPQLDPDRLPWLTAGYARSTLPSPASLRSAACIFSRSPRSRARDFSAASLRGKGRWIAAGAFVGPRRDRRSAQGHRLVGARRAGLTASLLQGNIPQDLKFDPARYARTLDTYLRLAEQSRGRLIVLPETALRAFSTRSSRISCRS
jgi:apolipoprotein N-acyltransferase